MTEETTPLKPKRSERSWEPILGWIVLVILLGVGAYFRFTGLNWDDFQHLHPDERFLTMVEASIQPVDSLSQYFNTAQSTLNPNNMGYGFFVYGTVPIFIVRYVAQALGQTGYDQVFLVGRASSAAVDLLAVLLVYLVAQRLFMRRWLSLIAAGFYTAAVLPIQLSHFFAVDTYTNTFGLAALYFAVVIFNQKPGEMPGDAGQPTAWDWIREDWRSVVPYVLFGGFYGLAMASKISILPLALLLPGAAFVAWTRLSPRGRIHQWPILFRNLILGGIIAFAIFRIGQPYAFKGPGFFNIQINPEWIQNITSLEAQSNGNSDSPPELQWARRPATFAWTNMVDWGLGLPLGLLATLGFAWMGWRILRGKWREYGLIWVWTGAYFLWQGLSFTRTMRYEIPVYPTLIFMAAWLVLETWDHLGGWLGNLWKGLARLPWGKIVASLLGVGILGATLAWAFAFTRIYTRTMTRVAATQWIYQNVPGPINLQILPDQGAATNYPLSYPNDAGLYSSQSLYFSFTPQFNEAATELNLPNVTLTKGDAGTVQFVAALFSSDDMAQALTSGTAMETDSLQSQNVNIAFDHLAELKSGQRYTLKLDLTGEHSSASLPSALLLKVADKYDQMTVNVSDVTLVSGQTFTLNFVPTNSGSLSQVHLPVALQQGSVSQQAAISLSIIDSDGALVGNANLAVTLAPGMAPPIFHFDTPVSLTEGTQYLVTVDVLYPASTIPLNGQVQFDLMDNINSQPLPAPTHLIQAGEPYLSAFTASTSGALSGVSLGWAVQQDPIVTGNNTLKVAIIDASNSQMMGEAQVTADLQPVKDPRGTPVQFQFTPAIGMVAGHTYFLSLTTDQGAIGVRGSAPANESSWDDGLPLRMNGLDGFNGIYQSGLNFEMYFPDDAAKLDRFLTTLDQADYIFITSSRQWGSTTRVQERYPLTTEYYRALLGCPATQSVIYCYRVAQPGMYQGQLGFQLIQVFQSEPNLGSWQFNTQFAEEAFTVYDHPKVFIFKKTAAYSPQQVQNLLGAVNLGLVVNVTPREAGVPANLMLPSGLLGQQQAGGTWSNLFNWNAVVNRWPGIGAVVWYLFVLLLGWMVYPFVRLALGGLSDHGYPVSRLVGLILLAFVVWIGGSSGVPFTRTFIWLVLGGLLVVNLVLFIMQRDDILNEIRHQSKFILLIEGLFLAFFIIDLLIRIGNPDLWHPAKGGEKPMDFSFLNAVIKSTSFPPYDPWFAGGYINYYYYGFVLVGVPIKALGIVPSIAYNLVLPTLFAMVAIGAFSVGWNLLSYTHAEGESVRHLRWFGVELTPFLAGLAAAIGMLILGNLGTLNMIWEGFQLMVVPQDVMTNANFFTRMGWMFQGILKYIGGMTMPYNIGEWYWNPSRAIPGEPITEFPFFTFLYADLHAHLIALPVTVLSLSWALNIIKGKWKWGVGRTEPWAWLQFVATFGLGGLTIGALRPTNTWDMPVYLVLGCLAVIYTVMRYANGPQRIVRLVDRIRLFLAEMEGDSSVASVINSKWTRWGIKFASFALPAVLLLVALSFFLYQPFANWYGQAYNSIEPWTGDHTPMWSYRMHWGVFLFILASWMLWESIDWMAKTPVSSLNKLRPYLALIGGGGVALVGAIVYLTLKGVAIAWIPLIMGTWAVLLILRPGQPDLKRAVLFMIGTALALTLAVEVIVLKGDIGRMNTVFKFYMQAWTLFSLSAGAALIWLLPAILRWQSNWSKAWQVAAVFLIGSAALYPFLAGQAKIQDRMATDAPHTLDGMTYMAYSTYSDQNKTMNLVEDYNAIRWMQENIQGSPVIVEANTPEYRWGTRYTIYTGLPGVVGWNWHERQQRAMVPSTWVTDRVDQVGVFYSTVDETVTLNFLRDYNVKYIVVGQLEEAYYPAAGLAKFEEWNGKYWKVVYQQGQTTIYEVLQ